MVTNKKRFRKQIQFLLMAAAVIWLAGCTPAGPRALLRGKKLIEQGRYTEAIEELNTATSILATNAQAWNYLGLACHYANQPANAIDAYERALKLNHDLVIVHYNLGCVLLEQNRPDTLEAARNELTAFTLHQNNAVNGWLKLGTAQLRLGELAAAETSFKEALRLSPQNAEAENDLGMAQLQRRRPRDAAAWFNAVVKQQPNYAPALLNLAVTEIYLNNRPLALQKYQDYLALNPRPANWEAVSAAAQQLDLELNPPPNPRTPSEPVADNPPANVPAHPAPTNLLHPENPAVAQTRPPSIPPPKPVIPTDTASKPEPVKLTDNQPSKVGGVMGTPDSTEEVGNAPPLVADSGNKPPKKGFFERLNPMGLFHHDAKPPPAPRPPTLSNTLQLASADSGSTAKPSPAPAVTPLPPRRVVIARYPYLLPGKPSTGNRAESDRLLAQGGVAQRDHRLRDAESLYRSATLADPSSFEAQASLGVVALELDDMPQALRAYELAVAIDPDSFNARFNFGLALKKANYIQDAAEELERLVSGNPAAETTAHLTVAHLTLGNLYADQFHQNAAARAHYLKVLELDPHNSQATAIRYWLQDNP